MPADASPAAPRGEHWVASMHPDVRSLQGFYAEGKPRQ